MFHLLSISSIQLRATSLIFAWAISASSSFAARLTADQFRIAKTNLDLGNYGLVLKAADEFSVESRVRLLRGQALDAASSTDALRPLIMAQEIAPEDAETNAWFGYVSAKLDHFDLSRTSLDKALQLDPHNAFAHAAKGYYLERLHKDGASEFKQAVKLDPESVAVRLLLIDTQVRKLDLDGAFREVAALLKKHPTMPLLRVKEGQLFEEKGDRSKAEESYSRAIAINPHFQLAYILKAKLFSVEGRWADAITACKGGLIADTVPDLRRQAFRMQIIGEEKLGRSHEVIADAIAYLKDGDNSKDESDATAKVWLSKALAEEQLNNYNDALKSINTVIARSRRKTEGLTIKANIYREMGDNQSALRLLNSLISRDDFIPQWHKIRAKVLTDLGDSNQAKKDFERAKELENQL